MTKIRFKYFFTRFQKPLYGAINIGAVHDVCRQCQFYNPVSKNNWKCSVLLTTMFYLDHSDVIPLKKGKRIPGKCNFLLEMELLNESKT